MGVDLEDIGVFNAVVRHRGFTAAARELGMPPSVVSRRIARLEEQVGFKLLHRTTRRVGLTESGRVFYDRTARVPRVVDEAIRAVANTRATPTGRVRLTAPPDDGGVIWALLEGFVQDHPEVDLEITHTLERVDLIEQEVDVALRGGAPPDSALFTAHALFDTRILLAASPEYLAVRGRPERVEDLAQHDGVCMDPWAPNAIRRLDGDRAPARVQLRNRIRANSLETARRAALAGLGVAPLLELTCRDELATGALEEVLRGALPDAAPFWVISPLGKARSAAATALVRHIIVTAASMERR